MYVEESCRSKTTSQDDNEELVEETNVLQKVVFEHTALVQDVQNREGGEIDVHSNDDQDKDVHGKPELVTEDQVFQDSRFCFVYQALAINVRPKLCQS